LDSIVLSRNESILMDRRRFAQNIVSGLLGGGLLSGRNLGASTRGRAFENTDHEMPSPSEAGVSEVMRFPRSQP
jgi:hypothetical protein